MITGHKKYMVFDFDATTMALDMNNIISVEKIDNVGYVDETMSYCVFNFENDRIPAINMDSKSIAKSQNRIDRRAIIVETKGHKFGIIVPKRIEIVDFNQESIVSMPKLISKFTGYIDKVAIRNEKIVLIIDIDKFFDKQIADFISKIDRCSDDNKL